MKGFTTLFKKTLLPAGATFKSTKDLVTNSFYDKQKICLTCVLLFAFFLSQGQFLIKRNRVQTSTKRTIAGSLITKSAITCSPGTCTPAGTIVVDGNPCDWNSTNFSTFPIRSYMPDPFGNGVVYKVAPKTLTATVLHSFAGGDDGCGPNGGLVTDTAGNLYGTTYQGGKYNAGVVFRQTP